MYTSILKFKYFTCVYLVSGHTNHRLSSVHVFTNLQSILFSYT